MADVQIDFATLNRMAIAMKQVAVELEGGDERIDQIVDAVDEPFPGRSELAQTVSDAGGAWAHRRRVLVQRAIDAAVAMDVVGSAWQDWDAGAGVTPETALPPLEGDA